MNPNTAIEGDPPDDVADATHYVLGGGETGIAIAEQLRRDGFRVAVVAESDEREGVPVVVGDPSALDVLADAGVGGASTVVVASRSDRRNLLVAQLVRARFDVPRVVSLVNDPDRQPVFTEAGHEPLCVTNTLSEALRETL